MISSPNAMPKVLMTRNGLRPKRSDSGLYKMPSARNGTEIIDRMSSTPTEDSPKCASISLAISVFIRVPICDAISSVI